MTVAKAAETVLRKAQRPMHVREIHKAIEQSGLFEFHAKDPVSVVSKALRTNNQFEKTTPGTYKLR